MPICFRCHAEFPNHVRINGRGRNLQRRKFCLDCSPFGSHNTKDLALQPHAALYESLARYCSGCRETRPTQEFYPSRNGLGRSKYCKPCANRQTVLRQQRLKQAAVNYKGGCCSHCGYSRYIGSLEFHHVDPSKKDFNLAAAHCTNFEKIKSELDKCIVLCANCHREEHARLKGLF